MGDAKKEDPRTVFVRGIDASVTDAQLQEFFSEVGPVKNAFLVRRGGKDAPHKGFGFVQFAVQEDATRAVAELHGTELAGRKLKVEGAVKRAPLEERKKRKQEAAAAPGQQQQAGATPAAAEQPPAAKKPRPAAPRQAAKPSAGAAAAAAAADPKHKWVRTVAVGGLTAEALSSAIQMAKSAGEVEEVIQPVPDKLAGQFKLKRDGCTEQAFLAVYKSVKQAMEAVTKLHGQTAAAAAGSAATAGGKKGDKKGPAVAAAGAGCRVWARQLSGDGLHQKRWRLIVRNLPFTASEADLQAAFEAAGFVWELALPRSATGRGRGFAFVGFTCRAHAERGIKLVNGQAVAGRPVAVDWAVAKAQYGSQQQQEAGAGGDGEAEGDGAAAGAGAGAGPGSKRALQGLVDGLDSDSEGEEGEAKLGHQDGDGAGGAAAAAAAAAALEPEQERRMLHSVIDGILDSSDEEAGEEEDEEDSEGSEGEEGESDDDAGEETEESGEGGSESEQEQEDDSSSSGGEEEEEEAVEDEEEGAAATAAAPADPFSRKQLQQKAAALGVVEQGGGGDAAQQQRARAEPDEGATVFIRGLPLDVSKEQVFLKMKAYGPVRSCRLVVDKASGKLKGTAFVDFYKRASAEAAAEACAKGRRKQGPGVVIAGRVAEVDMAVGQEDARALSAKKAAEHGGPRDRRHLALAKEGQIVEGSPAWEDMSAGDRAKRKRAAEEKKLKLKSPNFVVSDMRLSVRNIPLSWTEKQLKQAFIGAVMERASKAQPHVKQVKILMDEERTGPDGAPRSKGIGFVQFTEHEHALCALRQLNNNPKTFSKDRRPIVEFALENVKALKLREAKLAKVKEAQQPRQAQQAAAGADGVDRQPPAGKAAAGGQQQHRDGQQQEGEAAAPEKSKRQQRKERRLMLKERRKQQRQQQQQQQQQQQGGDGSPAAAADNGVPGGSEKSKSARRRELRKRKQQGQQGQQGATAATVLGATQPSAAVKLGTAPQQQQGAQKQQQQQQRQQQQRRQKPAQQQQLRPAVNSRAAKAAAASQQEQQAQQRKRTADALIDQLAEGPQGELRRRKKSKKEQTDNVDKLARQYMQKYFDVPAAGKGKGKGAAGSGSKQGGGAAGAASKAAAAASLKRWFD